LGLSPWRTPIEIWEAKVHPENVEELDKECLWFGSALEPIIRERYAMKFGVEVVPPNRLGELFPKSRPWRDSMILTGPHDWMIGMPDGFMPSVNTGLEIKTASRRSDEWGEAGSADVPVQYLLQVVYYMAITQAPAWNIAVLFSGSDLQHYRVVRDLDLERDTIEACRQFWEDYCVKQVPPPIDATESYGRYLAKRFSLSTGAVITEPSPEIISWTEKMKDAETREKEAAAEKQLANNQLRALIGDAQKAITPLGSIGWVRPQEKDVTDWAEVGKAVGPLHPEIVEANTKPEQRTAYLRAWWSQKKKVKEFAEVEEF
jgi:predicted phage-related endonuclease